MWVTCDKCGRSYDDATRWTICPHSPLGCAVDDLCSRCDTLKSVHGPCRHQLILQGVMNVSEPQVITVAEYRELALRTEADQAKILARLVELGPQAMRLDNAARGLAGDAGEVATCVMKFIEYGKPLDVVNLLEEVGDVLWRLNQLCAAAEGFTGTPFTLEMAMAGNIRKLAARYGEKYTDQAALNRDKEAERKALEGANFLQTGFQATIAPVSSTIQSMSDLLAEKHTWLMYDNDHPRLTDWPNARLRGEWMMTARSDRLTPLAVQFLEFVRNRMRNDPAGGAFDDEIVRYALCVYAEVIEKLPRGVGGYEPKPEDREWLLNSAAEESRKRMEKLSQVAPVCQYCTQLATKAIVWLKVHGGPPDMWCGCDLNRRGRYKLVEGEDYRVEPLPNIDGGKDADSAKLNPSTTRT